MSRDPSDTTEWTWPRTIVVVTPSGLAAFAWLAVCGIYTVGTAPSNGVDSQNSVALILLAPVLIGAFALTAIALFAVCACTRSRTTRIITLVLGTLMMIAAVALVLYGRYHS